MNKQIYSKGPAELTAAYVSSTNQRGQCHSVAVDDGKIDSSM